MVNNMSCKYACNCSGNCCSCGSYSKESYFGEAEDILAQQLGYDSFEDHMQQKRLEDEQYKAYCNQQQ
jgi:hypothetical protein